MVIGAVIVAVFIMGAAYFFLSSETAKTEIPSFVTGDMRAMYEWAKSPNGSALLQQIPCYCGCVYEGHKNAYNCFWRDDGNFDKHGTTCSVCQDIAKQARLMYGQGNDTCTIRKTIDAFYAPNKELATPTPLPAGCVE